jgi:hypothetical protein
MVILRPKALILLVAVLKVAGRATKAADRPARREAAAVKVMMLILLLVGIVIFIGNEGKDSRKQERGEDL